MSGRSFRDWLRGRERGAPDASETLRRYNDAEAERLSALAAGRTPTDVDGTVLTSVSRGPISGTGELAVEDVFTITGRGQVATGHITAGTLRVGEAVVIVRAGGVGESTEIAGIEMFRRRVDEATAGDMVGVLLRDRSDVASGDVIRATAFS